MLLGRVAQCNCVRGFPGGFCSHVTASWNKWAARFFQRFREIQHASEALLWVLCQSSHDHLLDLCWDGWDLFLHRWGRSIKVLDGNPPVIAVKRPAPAEPF